MSSECVSVKIYRRVFMGTHMMFFSVNISKHLIESACDVMLNILGLILVDLALN